MIKGSLYGPLCLLKDCLTAGLVFSKYKDVHKQCRSDPRIRHGWILAPVKTWLNHVPKACPRKHYLGTFHEYVTLTHYRGTLLWHITLTHYLGKLLWHITLARYSYTLSWHVFLACYFGELKWYSVNWDQIARSLHVPRTAYCHSDLGPLTRSSHFCQEHAELLWRPMPTRINGCYGSYVLVTLIPITTQYGPAL